MKFYNLEQADEKNHSHLADPSNLFADAYSAASAADTPHNPLAASDGAYDCKPSTIHKIASYGDEIVVRGAFDAWLGSKFGTAGAIIGGVLGAGDGAVHARWQLKGEESDCLRKHYAPTIRI